MRLNPILTFSVIRPSTFYGLHAMFTPYMNGDAVISITVSRNNGAVDAALTTWLYLLNLTSWQKIIGDGLTSGSSNSMNVATHQIVPLTSFESGSRLAAHCQHFRWQPNA